MASSMSWREVLERGIHGLRGEEALASSFEEGVHTIFVDNLPSEVRKGELFREFGRDGNVRDVYIFRKQRSDMKSPFAFIRFDAAGGARRAIDRLNSKIWRGTKLFITVSRYRRNDPKLTNRGKGHWKHNGVWIEKSGGMEREKRKRQIWVEVGNKNAAKMPDAGKGVEKPRRKEVTASTCENQQEFLSRSLMGVNIKLMDHKTIKRRLMEEWNGSGQVECRDVGPFRCLLTFDLKEIREEASVNPALLSIFDEVRPHWDFVWSPSQRVWVEVMGVPVHVWSSETMENIVKLWGKMVVPDIRPKRPKSIVDIPHSTPS
ncbi:hypothetical protein PIB30_032469 [Stylosanthes scabra]|uniref:RRM domain-containing protein n=1 Tax=Stylosanthes scabra TaxID=79078 RepID=A0ABU6TDZ9_9FABA|nr:hypothetical protein [Stylosanthes scabra]